MGRPLPHPTPQATCELRLTGRLVGKAHAAHRPTDRQGHFAPALCFEVETVPGGRRCHVEQYFAPDQQAACEAAAKTLRAGDVVSFHVDAHNFHLKACDVKNLAPAGAEPATPEDLFQSAPLPAPAHA